MILLWEYQTKWVFCGDNLLVLNGIGITVESLILFFGEVYDFLLGGCFIFGRQNSAQVQRKFVIYSLKREIYEFFLWVCYVFGEFKV